MTVFNGTPGNDSLPGAGQDFSSNNTISGLDGNDTINAQAGNDSVDGGAGNDSILGGAGDDTLLGGAGNDTITDFAVGTGTRGFDILDFSAFGFSASDLVLSSGATVGVSAAEFNANNYKIALISRATETSDWQIMYRDGETTSTLTLKYNQAIAWDAKYFDFTP
jgi:Ca2+-binding RTX toxin-like protein